MKSTNAVISFDSIGAIEVAPTKDLLAFFNDNAANPVKKFADRATAIKRCIDLYILLANEEGDSEGDSEVAAPWPFNPPVRENGKIAPEPEETETEDKPKKTRSRSSNSEGVALSWLNPEVKAARLIRNGVSVTLGSVKSEFKSTRDAFRFYRLPDSKHIRFRGILKAAKEATFRFDEKDYIFNIL